MRKSLMLMTALSCLVCATSVLALARPRFDRPSPIERDVLDEVNWARTHPDLVADYLERTLAPLFLPANKLAFLDEPTTRAPLPEEHGVYVGTQEGLGLVRETVTWLRTQRPLPAVAWNDTLGGTAEALVLLHGPIGETGHDRHGVDWMSLASGQDARLNCCGETNAYGTADPRAIVIELIVDDGVANRGHRNLIYDPKSGFNVVGIAVGPHKTFRAMCVIDWGALAPASPR